MPITPGQLRQMASMLEEHGEDKALQIEIPSPTWERYLKNIRKTGEGITFGKMLIYFDCKKDEFIPFHEAFPPEGR